MNRMDPDKHSGVTSIIIAVLCAALGLLLIVLPKSDWSENENRRLAEFPEPTGEAVASGEFFENVNTYLTDHFPLRDVFVSVNTRVNMLLGRKEINGVYICADGYLMDSYDAPEHTQEILASWNKLPERCENARVSLLAAPTAVTVYSDKLPAFAQNADQTETLAQLYSGFGGQTVDVTDTLLAHRQERQLYYRTDHHWTTWGAYYAYAELAPALGFEPTPAEDYLVDRVTSDFCGTTYSKVNDFTVEGEDMYRFVLPGQRLSVVYGLPDRTTSGSDAVSGEPGVLYNPEYLEKKDKYSYFLDNIHAALTITNEQAQSERELVVIKDSYANCLVPFLIEHFRRIYVIDPRYHRDSIIDFVNSDEAITDVLLLYNLGTLDGDTGVRAIF